MGAARAVRRRGGVLRGLSGVFTGGLVVLALVLVGAAVIGGRDGAPGPGALTLIMHVAAALAAVVVQVYADRHDSRRGMLAAVGVLGITAAVLAFEWLS